MKINISIDDFIDNSITEFLDAVDELSYSDCNILCKMLESEGHRVKAMQKRYVDEKEHYANKFFLNKKDRERLSTLMMLICTSYLVEQAINDRLLLAERVKKSKGIDLSIFNP